MNWLRLAKYLENEGHKKLDEARKLENKPESAHKAENAGLLFILADAIRHGLQ